MAAEGPDGFPKGIERGHLEDIVCLKCGKSFMGPSMCDPVWLRSVEKQFVSWHWLNCLGGGE